MCQEEGKGCGAASVIFSFNKEHCKKSKGFSLIGLQERLRSGVAAITSKAGLKQRMKIHIKIYLIYILFNTVVKHWVRDTSTRQVLDPNC